MRNTFESLAQWFNRSVHSLGYAIRRRECCKINFENKKCEFTRHLRERRRSGEKYFYASFQTGHEEQKEFVITALRRRGFLSVEEIQEVAASDHPLCRTCLSLRLASRVLIDGTSSALYDKSCGVSAFILGMATGIGTKRQGETVRIKMLYDERVGPIGMFAGARASWQGDKWRDQIAREVEDW
jgi:hypothetical protein